MVISDWLLAHRAPQGQGRFDPVNSARSAWEYPLDYSALRARRVRGVQFGRTAELVGAKRLRNIWRG
jgi:hypothetical protein